MPIKPKAIGYIRVSETGKESAGYCLGRQADAIEMFCEIHGLDLTSHFCENLDEKSWERPSLSDALAQLHCNKADVLLVSQDYAVNRQCKLADRVLLERNLKRAGKALMFVRVAYGKSATNLYRLKSNQDAVQHLVNCLNQPDVLKKHSTPPKTNPQNLQNPQNIKADKAKNSIDIKDGTRKREHLYGWKGNVPYEFDLVQGRLFLNQERWRQVRHIYRLSKLKDENGQRRFGNQKIAAYMNGANNLVDPTTGKNGRRFKRNAANNKARKGRGTLHSGNWTDEACRVICLTMESGRRQTWHRKIAAMRERH